MDTDTRVSMAMDTMGTLKRGKLSHVFQGQKANAVRSLPTLLLALATVSALFSGIALRNHSKLVECELFTIPVTCHSSNADD